jgi:glucan-binding YG repeat protein
MKSMKKILSVILTAVILSTMPHVTALAADPSGDTEQLLRISDEFEATNPNGAFSLASMAVETHEYSGRVVTEVIRQGGAAGRVEVTLRAIDVSAKIGQDYSLSIPESFFTKDITGGGNSETLLDGTSSVTGAALSNNTAHPTEQDEANSLSETETPAENRKSTVSENSTENGKLAESKTSAETVPTTVSAAAVTGTAITGLRAARLQATGAISDRSKFAYTDRQKSELVNTARLAAMDYYTQLPGTEFTLSFDDGERTRSIYIDILNDTIPETDEQIILVITNVTGGGVIGLQKDTTINILDDEPYEKPVISFSSYHCTAGSEAAAITLTRTSGLNYYAGGQISTLDGSAASGIDYTPLNQSFLFLPGQEQLQILVPVMRNESDFEKTFFVRAEPNESCQLSGDAAVQVLIPKASQSLPEGKAAMKASASSLPAVPSLPADDPGITLGKAQIKYGKEAANYTNVGSEQGKFFVNSGGWYEVNIQHDSISSGVRLNKTLYKSMLKSISTDITLYKLRKDNNFDVWIDAEFISEITKKFKDPISHRIISIPIPSFSTSRNLLYGRNGYDVKKTNLPVMIRNSADPIMNSAMAKIGGDPFRLSLKIRNGNKDYGAMRLYGLTLNFRHFEFQIQPFGDSVYTFDFSKDEGEYEKETGPVGEMEITDDLGRKVKDFYTSEDRFEFNVKTKNVKPGFYLKELRFWNNTDSTNADYKTYPMDKNGGRLVIDNDFLIKYNGYSMNSGGLEALLVQPVFVRDEASLTVRLEDTDTGKGQVLGVSFDDGSASKTFTKNNTEELPLHVGDKVILTGVGNGSQAVTGYYVTLGNGSDTGSKTMTEATDEHGAGIVTLTLSEAVTVTPIFGERAFSVKPDPGADPELRGTLAINYNLHKEKPDYITFKEEGRLTGIESGKPVEIIVIPPKGYTTQWANRTGDTNGNGVLDDSEVRENGVLYRMYDYNQDGLIDAEYNVPLFGDFISYKVNQPQPLFYYNFVPLAGQLTFSGKVTGYVLTKEYDIRNGFTMDKNGYKLTPVTGATVKMGGSYNPANPDAQIGYEASTESSGKFSFDVSGVIKNAFYILSISQGGSSFFVDKINPSASGFPYVLPTFTSMKPVSIDAYPESEKDGTVAGSVVMLKKKKVTFELLTASLENNIRVAGADFRVYSYNGTLKSSQIVAADLNRIKFTVNDLSKTFSQNDRLVVQLIDQAGGRSIEYDTGFELRPPLPASSVLPSFAADQQKSVPIFGTVMGALDLGLAHFEDVSMDKDEITITMGYEHAFDEYNKILKETGKGEDNKKDDDVIRITVEDIENQKKGIDNINNKDIAKKEDTNVKTKTTLSNNLSVNVSLEMKIKYDSKRPAGSGSPYYFNRLLLMVTLTDKLPFSVSVSLPIGLTVTSTLEVGGSVTGYIAITPITPIGATEPLRVYADEYGNYPYYDSDMFKSYNYKFNVNGGLIMKPYISLTISGDYSIGEVSVNGKAEFTLIFATDRDNSGTLKLSGNITVKVLDITVYEKSLGQGTINLFGSPGSKMMLTAEDEPSEQTTFAPASRAYLDKRSEWLGSEPLLDDVGPLLSSNTLQNGIYPDPDIQLMRIDADSILMVFTDDDPDRSDHNRAALSYSISQDNGYTWSEPIILSDDGTLDSNPRLVDLGDKILCLYSSLNQEIDSSNPITMEEMLEANELDMRFFDKAAGAFEGPATRITRYTAIPDPDNPGSFIAGDYTSDEYGNAVYDPVTKRLLIIYTKSDYTSDSGRTFSANDLFDTQKSYSTVAYLIYDTAAGRFQNYEEIGYPDGVDTGNAEDKARWEALWYGQKFLGTEIIDPSLPGGGISDPLVYDLTTAFEEGTAYIAYTVDMDNDLSTLEDRDIYLATYRFADNTFTKPIKASDLYPGEPPRADGRPQLVPYENSVYLFYAADSEIHYVKADVLLDPGLLLDTSGLGEAGTGDTDLITKEALPVYPHIALKSEEQHNPTEDYRVLTGDDGKLYLFWTEAALRYADGVLPGSQEALDPNNIYHEDQVFASIYYEDYDANFTYEHETADTRTDYENLSNPDVEYGRWSKKIQLSFGPGSYKDVGADVMADGRIILAAAKSDLAYSEKDQMLVNAPDSARLVTMTLVPGVRVTAETDALTFNPAAPKPGETVNITAAFSNQGLLPLIRPLVQFYAVRDGDRQLIGSSLPGSALYAGETGTASVTWTAPADLRNLEIHAILTGDSDDRASGETYAEFQAAFPYTTSLEYSLVRLDHIARSSYQVLAEVLNKGNQSLSGAELIINLVDPMDHTVRELKRVSLEDEAGSDGLLVLRESFELANADLEPIDGVMGGSASIEVRIEKNGTPLARRTGTMVKDITALYGEQINAAERVSLPAASFDLSTGSRRFVAASILPAQAAGKFRMVYRSSDPSVASVDENGIVTARKPGNAVISAYAVPDIELRILTVEGYAQSADILDYLSPEDCVNSSVQVAVYHNSNSGDGEQDNNSSQVTPTPKLTAPVTGSVVSKATVDSRGNASVSITDQNIVDAITNAQAEAASRGINAGTITLSIRISTVGADASSININLPKTVLQRIINNKIAGITFVTDRPGLILSLDLAAITQISRQANTGVQLTAAGRDASKLSKAAKKVIGSRPVYDFKVSYQNGTKQVTDFGNGKAYVSIPYTPDEYDIHPGEAAGYLYAVYVDAKGNPTRIDDSFYDTNSKSIIFTTDHFSLYGVGYTPPHTYFADIDSHWAMDSINYVVGRGLLSGTSETKFAPDNALTRGMLATALGRLAGVDVKVYTQSSFTDVKADNTFRPYIEWAYKKGIIRDIGSRRFAPDRAVTREEIALIFANFAKTTGYKLPVTRSAVTFEDASTIGSRYTAAVTAMQQAGIVMGRANNRFTPKAHVTRAEVSSMLHRLVKLTIDPATAGGWTLNDDGQYLYYKDGMTLAGWQLLDGTKYFFNTDGTLNTGWVKDGDNLLYYSGNRASSGWQDIDNKRYYFTRDGIMVAGKWLELGAEWYYFHADGALAKNTEVDGYKIDKNGVRKTK